MKSSNHHASLLVYLNLETGEQSELFQEDKLDHELDIKATKDRKYLIISSTSKISSDMYCIAMEDKIDRIFQIVDGSTADCQTFVEHIESHFVQVNYRD